LSCNERETYRVEPFCTPEALAQTGTPLPTPTAQSQPEIRLAYNEDSFILFNISPVPQNISGLAFEGDSFGSMAASEWRDMGTIGDEISRILPESCLQAVTRLEAVQAGPCRNFYGWFQQASARFHFWTAANGNRTFTVTNNGQPVAECEVSAGSCEFTLPE
jgi:hypothetical protein